MKLLIFICCTMIIHIIFFWFSKLGFLQKGMQWNTYYIKFVIGKQDGSKVEGNNLEKNVIFTSINQYKYDHL